MSIYSDLNNNLDPTQIEDVNAVIQAIGNLLVTWKGERFFNPEIGSNVEDILFEPMSDDVAFELYSRLIESIQRDEPRVRILGNLSDVVPDYDNNKYDVTLVFEIQGLEGQQFEYNGDLARRLIQTS